VSLSSSAISGETVARAGCHGKGRIPPLCQPGIKVRALAELSRPVPVGTERITVGGYAAEDNRRCDSSVEFYRGGRYRCLSDIVLELTSTPGDVADSIRLLRRSPRGLTPYRCDGDRTGVCCELPVHGGRLAVTVEVPAGSDTAQRTPASNDARIVEPNDYVVTEICSLDREKEAAR
jgi:hypothetical protein